MIRSLSFHTNKRRVLAIIITLLLHIVIFAYFFYKYSEQNDVDLNTASQKTAMALSWSETNTNTGKTDEEPVTTAPEVVRKALPTEPKPHAKPLELTNPIIKPEAEPVTKPNIAFKPIPKPRINVVTRNLNKPYHNQAVTEYTAYSTLPTSRPVTPEEYIGDNKKPDYPTDALIRNLEGNVELDALINHLGKVEEVRITQTSGHRILDRAAVRQVKKWNIKPTELMKHYKLKQWVHLPHIKFKLNKNN